MCSPTTASASPRSPGLVSLYLLPSSWRFLVGPLLDVSLTPRLWFLLATGAQTLVLLAFALTPLKPWRCCR